MKFLMQKNKIKIILIKNLKFKIKTKFTIWNHGLNIVDWRPSSALEILFTKHIPTKENTTAI